MSPPLGLEVIMFFPKASVSVCLSHLCPLYNLKTIQAIFMKLHTYQSALDDMQSAGTITLAFILFELFPLDYVTK